MANRKNKLQKTVSLYIQYEIKVSVVRCNSSSWFQLVFTKGKQKQQILLGKMILSTI